MPYDFTSEGATQFRLDILNNVVALSTNQVVITHNIGVFSVIFDFSECQLMIQ